MCVLQLSVFFFFLKSILHLERVLFSKIYEKMLAILL